MGFIYPDIDWYTNISEENGVLPHCPYANVHRCPRYHSSLYLLGEAGITTKINPEKVKELDELWQKSDLLPVVAEHDAGITSVGDKKSSFSNFCPEVSFDVFGLFAVYLHRYADEIDTETAHAQLEKKAYPKDWRWQWAHVEPLHYLKCPVYSQLLSKPVPVSEDSSTKQTTQWKKLFKNPWFITLAGGLIFFILGIFFYKGNIQTKGNYSPGVIERDYRAGDTISGDKIINYGTIISTEIAKTDKNNVATEEFIKDFFIRLELSISEKRKSIPQNELDTLPGYLKRLYDINITISTSHGVGYEFITPSDNPKINIIKTDLPIEEYYFSKYTDGKDFSKGTLLRISENQLAISNLIFIAGKKMIVVEQDGNVLLKNIDLKYAKEDTTKEIVFLRLFANNQKDYWNQINAKDEAIFLFDSQRKEKEAKSAFDFYD